MKCRYCETELSYKLLDLGSQPLANDYIGVSSESHYQEYFPLIVWVCKTCWLVQCEQFSPKEKIFDDEYAYFSSSSKSWLKHAEDFSTNVINNNRLSSNSFVVEIASNDGYLLENFMRQNIACLGIEPTKSTARVAEEKGIPTIQEFFQYDLVPEIIAKYQKADLIICNNVFAHVPNLIDFVRGLRDLLCEDGIITIEFPHLMELILGKKFDTIYHEHFSYFSLFSAKNILENIGLKIFDVEKLKSHGGSYRLFVCHAQSTRIATEAVEKILQEELSVGINNLSFYENFQKEAINIKNHFLKFLFDQKLAGKKVVAYGAAAKGNTLLNFSGVKQDLISAVFDASESKQGKLLPGSRIPILAPENIFAENPDYVVVLPWNLIKEIKNYLEPLTLKGTKIVTVMPTIKFH